jgi:hypothetical protein
MPVHRAVERPAVSATPSTIIARITIAGTIMLRSIGRRQCTSIISLIGKKFRRPTNWRLRMGTSRNAFTPENVARHEDIVSDPSVVDMLQSARIAHTFHAGARETRFVSACQ